MRGSIYKRGDSYRLAVSLGKDPETGKYKQHFETVRGNRKQAEQRLNQLIHEIDKGSFVEPGKITTSEYLKQWLHDYCQPNLAMRSTEEYEYIVNKYLIPVLGRIPLKDLKPSHIQRLCTERLEKGTTRTALYCYATLHKALNCAVKLGIASRNAADGVERPKPKPREMQTLSENDVARFLKALKDNEYFSLFYCSLFTGLRRSELLALKWIDVDLPLAQLSVRRTIHTLRNGKVIYGEPKTAKSRRLVSLSPSTCRVLAEHRAKQVELRRSLGLQPLSEDSLVFSHWDGSPLLPDTVSHTFMNLARKCGLNNIRLHDLRHSHASLLLKQNTHPKIVSERLGHANTLITLDLYSHVTPGLQQAAAKRFDSIIDTHADYEAVKTK